jgi:hypothetical protein
MKAAKKGKMEAQYNIGYFFLDILIVSRNGCLHSVHLLAHPAEV